MLSLINRLFGKKAGSDESPYGEVSYDEVAVRYSRAGQADVTIPWDRLSQVSIITTDLGPFQEDVFFAFKLSKDEEEYIVPQGAKGTDILLSRLSKLDGYDDRKVIQAMGSTEDARFVCWEK